MVFNCSFGWFGFCRNGFVYRVRFGLGGWWVREKVFSSTVTSWGGGL